MHRRRLVVLLAASVITGCMTPEAPAPAPAAGPAIPVRQAQAGLTALGYRVGPVDGVLGPMTSAAVLRFRQREGLETPADADPEAAIDVAFSERLAERLAYDGLKWRQRARAMRARQTAPPEPPADGQRDAALEDLLGRWENGTPPAE